MNRKTIAISAAAAAIAAALAGTAIAREHGGHKDPFGDKTVTSAEVQAHAAGMFAKHDANNDGKLDAADRAAHHGAMFEEHDTNKDGVISRAEFDAAHQDGMRGEHGAGEHGRGKHGGEMRMMMMHMADANNDSAVSKDEFVAAQIAMFAKADANKDGKLTQAERQAAHAKMREQMKSMHAGHDGAAGAADPHAGH
jgi:Ca2+-binding EF-hand superfamily protein